MHNNRLWGTFQLTRLLRGVTFNKYLVARHALISTHTPLARRDTATGNGTVKSMISTHTPLARRDTELALCGRLCFLYISTHTPLARRDRINNHTRRILLFISTHTPLARRDRNAAQRRKGETISTHTPLARRDAHKNQVLGLAIDISTHTPLARRDRFRAEHITHMYGHFNSHASCEA